MPLVRSVHTESSSHPACHAGLPHSPAGDTGVLEADPRQGAQVEFYVGLMGSGEKGDRARSVDNNCVVSDTFICLEP